MNVLFVGDIVGRPGRGAFKALLPEVVKAHGIDLVVANAENAAAGFGITGPVIEEIFAAGADVLTSGNHIWDKKEALEYIQHEPRLIRPLNYPPGSPGNGVYIHETAEGLKVAILNASGRVFMPPLDCPFRGVDETLASLPKVDAIILDFHAEATSEKVSMGWHLDGRVSAVIGTHTHVQTADDRILPGGTAYITDVGMTGPRDSVIGMGREVIVERFITMMPKRFSVADGIAELCAVVVSIDTSTSKATSITRLKIEHEG